MCERVCVIPLHCGGGCRSKVRYYYSSSHLHTQWLHCLCLTKVPSLLAPLITRVYLWTQSRCHGSVVILFGGHHLISLVLGAGGACGQWFGLLVGEMEAGGWKYQDRVDVWDSSGYSLTKITTRTIWNSSPSTKCMYMMYNAVASLRVGYFPCMQNVFCEIVSLGTFLIAACHNNISFFSHLFSWIFKKYQR